MSYARSCGSLAFFAASVVTCASTRNCEFGGKRTSSSAGIAEKWRMSFAPVEAMMKSEPCGNVCDGEVLFIRSGCVG